MNAVSWARGCLLAGLAIGGTALPCAAMDEAASATPPRHAASLEAASPHRDSAVEPSGGPGLGPLRETGGGWQRLSPRPGPTSERAAGESGSAAPSAARARAVERLRASFQSHLSAARCGRLGSPPTGPPSTSSL